MGKDTRARGYKYWVLDGWGCKRLAERGFMPWILGSGSGFSITVHLYFLFFLSSRSRFLLSFQVCGLLGGYYTVWG